VNKQMRAKKSKWCKTYHKRTAVVDTIAGIIIGLFGLGIATGGAPLFGACFIAFSIISFTDALRASRRHLQQKRRRK